MKQVAYWKYLLFIIAIILTSVFVSWTFSTIGSKLLIKDRISEAKTLYKIATIFNPLSQKANIGLTIARVIKEERKGESEETNFEDKPIVFGESGAKAVLGSSVTVPILMYHYIRINPNPNDKVGFNLSVTPENFSQQMGYLVSRGYHTISLDELGAHLLYDAKLPDKPIVITLDDGYSDSYTTALPILKSYGVKAVSFITTGFVGGPNYLTWQQIDEMKGSSVFTFASHAVTHPALTYLTQDRITHEIVESKKTLQSHVGYPINWFAYPYGNVNPSVLKIVQQAGYVGAFGTNRGTYHSRNAMLTLPRIRIGGSDTLSSFAAKLPW